MKKRWYKAMTLDGSMTIWRGDHLKSREEARDIIDQENLKTIDYGGSPKPYAIIHCEETEEMFDEVFHIQGGLFYKRTTEEICVEHYPELEKK